MLTYDVAKIFKKPHEFEKFLERMNLYLHCICFFCQIFLLKILTKLVDSDFNFDACSISVF